MKYHSYLDSISTYVPGLAEIDGKKLIKMSSNENALGASPLAIQAYSNHSLELFRYADGACTNLRHKLAKKNSISPERIVCGAGSDELITLLIIAFAGIGDEVIYSEHGFLMYPISTQKAGAIPVRVKESGLKTDIVAIAKAVTKKTKIIFLANPNNPTGSYLSESELESLITSIPQNVLIVLDHAYEEFVTAADYPSGIKLVNRYPNVVMLRTFSKIYGLASLRIGWCYASDYISEALNKVRGPFNVGGPAQVAAVAALDDDDFVEKSRQHVKKWREIFAKELGKSKSLKLHPATANFILLDFGSADKAQQVNKMLLENNFILREMKGYGLPHCLRITIGNEAENQQIIQLLKAL